MGLLFRTLPNRDGELVADGKAMLFDGRSESRSRTWSRLATCAIMKLHHLVDDSIHACLPAVGLMITCKAQGRCV